MSKREFQIAITLLLIFAAGLRFVALEQIPPGLHYDEAANALLAGDIGLRGERPVFIPSYTGKEVLYFYLAGGVMAVLGESIFALRLTSALVGILTVAVTYRLGWAIFRDRRIGLLAALLITFHFQHLLFSRLGFRAITQPLLQGLTVLLLLKGIIALGGDRLVSSRKIKSSRLSLILFGVAGLFLGLTAYTYLAARLFPLVLGPALFLLIWGAWRGQNQLGRPLPAVLLMGGVALLVLTPLLLYFQAHPDAFWVRIGQVGGGEAGGISIREGLRRTRRMLFWPSGGDPYFRFNLPGMPLLGLIWSFFALIGLFYLISRIRQVRTEEEDPKVAYPLRIGAAVIVLALLLMRLPSALATAEIVPSNLRAIGILPFLHFFPALGLLFVWDFFLEPRWPKVISFLGRSVSSFGILLLGVGLIQGGITTFNYFQRWGTRADLYLENDGPLLSLADHLNHHASQASAENNQIFVTTRFAPHPTLAFGSEAGLHEQIVYLPRSEALVFPAGPEGGADDGDATLYFAADSPPADWMRPILGPPDLEEADFRGYSLPSADTALILPQVQTDTQFGYAMRLIGYDRPLLMETNTVGLTTYWEVLGPPGFAMTPFLHLEDGRGGRWGQVEPLVFDPASWQSGDILIQHLSLPIQPGTPPGEYQLRLGWFDPATGQGVARFSGSGQFAGDALLIEPITVPVQPLPTAQPTAPQPIKAEVRPGLSLLGYETGKRTVTNGEPLWVSLWWRAEQPLPEMTTRFELRQGEDGVILSSGRPVYGQYPFDQWETPQFLIDHQAPEIPLGQPAGEYELYLRLLAADESTLYFGSLGPVTVESSDILFESPELVTSLRSDARFGEQIELYTYVPPTADNGYELTLVWRTESRPTADYTTFVHLLNFDGSCCVWQDDLPAGGPERPSSIWLAGEFLVDRYVLTLPSDLPAGNYPLEIGLYLPGSGQRLTVSATAKHGEDYLFLREVSVSGGK